LKFKRTGGFINGSGIRDISRVLKISTNPVLSTLKKAYAQQPEREKPQKVTSVEVDEQCSELSRT